MAECKENTPEGELYFSQCLIRAPFEPYFKFLASKTFVETEICTFYLI